VHSTTPQLSRCSRSTPLRQTHQKLYPANPLVSRGSLMIQRSHVLSLSPSHDSLPVSLPPAPGTQPTTTRVRSSTPTSYRTRSLSVHSQSLSRGRFHRSIMQGEREPLANRLRCDPPHSFAGKGAFRATTTHRDHSRSRTPRRRPRSNRATLPQPRLRASHLAGWGHTRRPLTAR